MRRTRPRESRDVVGLAEALGDEPDQPLGCEAFVVGAELLEELEENTLAVGSRYLVPLLVLAGVERALRGGAEVARGDRETSFAVIVHRKMHVRGADITVEQLNARRGA
jgi:hypothetical protein